MLLVRQALRGVAETVALDEIELNDITTAVTEAANNVVTHAYGEDPGPLEVEIGCLQAEIEVLVRDRGRGIGAVTTPPRAASAEAVGGIGLPVIAALASSVEFSEPRDGGTAVRMRFRGSSARALEDALDEEDAPDASPAPRGEAEDAVALAVSPPALARAVLRRLLAALAVRARFSAERVTDTSRLADDLVSRLDGSFCTRRVSARISVATRNLEFTVGPLRAGACADGVASLLERFANGHDVHREDSSELLAVRLVEPPARARR